MWCRGFASPPRGAGRRRRCVASPCTTPPPARHQTYMEVLSHAFGLCRPGVGKPRAQGTRRLRVVLSVPAGRRASATQYAAVATCPETSRTTPARIRTEGSHRRDAVVANPPPHRTAGHRDHRGGDVSTSRRPTDSTPARQPASTPGVNRPRSARPITGQHRGTPAASTNINPRRQQDMVSTTSPRTAQEDVRPEQGGTGTAASPHSAGRLHMLNARRLLVSPLSRT